ncbi:MAG: hypothetical protein CSA34_02370 [Desulfobulbus propionicus]|nr:MAG: hypothetical protein CSA34_02370 [Desulfobulbus propionicus]
MRTIFLLLLAIFAGTLPCQAVDYHVNGATGQDTSTCGPLTQPCKTVKQAVDNAGTTTPVKVKIVGGPVGTYSENISLNNNSPQDLTLEGGWNPDFTHQLCAPGWTVLQQLDDEIYLLRSQRTEAKQYNLRLSCLTLRENTATGTFNSLIHVNSKEQAVQRFTMNRCLLEGYVGSGVDLMTYGNSSMNATIKNTIFRNAHPYPSGSADGGGVYTFSAGNSELLLTMENCMVYDNSAFRGGGMKFYSNGASTQAATLTNITVTNNHAAAGGGGLSAVSIDTSTLTVNLTNAIIHGNTDLGENDILLIQQGTSTTTVNASYSIIGDVDNNTATWNDNGHNLEVDPGLDSSYHLQLGSSAIDAGICGSQLGGTYYRIAPYFDIDGDPRPGFPKLNGCDIGADEYLREYVYVNGTTGQDTSTCGSLSEPCKTVKKAVLNGYPSTSLNVRIAAGTYVEHITLGGWLPNLPELTLQGGWNPNFTDHQCDPGLTVLEQPDDRDNVLWTRRTEAKQYNLRLSCLTLREPTGWQEPLVDIASEEQADFTFTMEHCVLDGCFGPGLRLKTRDDASMYAVITDTIFRNGRLAPYPGDPTSGGGVTVTSWNHSELNLTMKNCLIYNNSTLSGGGMQFYSRDATTLTAYLTNITIANNQAKASGGGVSAESWESSALTFNLTNAIIHGNSADNAENDILLIQRDTSTATVNARYSIIGEVVNHGATWNDNGHNLEVDPHLDSSYHLRSDSPAINAGICAYQFGWGYFRLAPYFDIDGDPRPPFSALTGCDIGADEYVKDSLCFPVKAKNGTTAIICL